MESSEDAEFDALVEQLPKEKQEWILKLKSKISDIINITTETEGWKEVNEKGDYIVHTKKTDSGVNWVRGYGPIDFSAEKVLEFMKSEGATSKYDDQYKEGRTVETIGLGKNVRVGYSRYKGATLVSDRDFVMILADFKDADGRILTIGTSIDHPDVPPVKKVVRADLLIGGWVLIPDQADPENKWNAYYISQSDLKGSIPKMITNSVSKGQGLLPKKINEVMKKQ